MNNWWRSFPSRTRRNRSSSHGSAFPPRISEGCSDSWPKRAPATDDLWVRKNKRRSSEGSVLVDRDGLDIDWTHAFEQFGRVFADPSHQLAYPSWVEIHVTCHVEHDSWKKRWNVIINYYVTSFLKVFFIILFYELWQLCLIVGEKIDEFQNLGGERVGKRIIVMKKVSFFFFCSFNKMEKIERSSFS